MRTGLPPETTPPGLPPEQDRAEARDSHGWLLLSIIGVVMLVVVLSVLLFPLVSR